ncbi:hypothetical protein [Spiroplasma endosymbiont of Virgichneumon dumeticola]|uniref:hypothetical protein n=1 Tax=Spiroplasma endosymbiont of Virgichneumon dumeticola TaxID=3139323 RepID=UPI0035C93F79
MALRIYDPFFKLFSRSQTPLISWFYIIFRWINTKHGIPSTDVAKELGVTLKI